MSFIRFVALCVFRNGNRILVGGAHDDVKDEDFLRPLGGSVEFGETAVEAIRREMREELHAEISNPVQLGLLESIFTCNGEPGHEIVAVFDAKLVDRTLYDMERVPLFEEVWGSEARWIDLTEPREMPLYPEGLAELLSTAV